MLRTRGELFRFVGAAQHVGAGIGRHLGSESTSVAFAVTFHTFHRIRPRCSLRLVFTVRLRRDESLTPQLNSTHPPYSNHPLQPHHIGDVLP